MHKQWQKQRDFREDAVMDNDNVPEGTENLSRLSMPNIVDSSLNSSVSIQ